jgi:hypothetical protein
MKPQSSADDLARFLQDHHGHVASIESAGHLYTVKLGTPNIEHPNLIRNGNVIHCCRFSRLEIKSL